MEVSIHNIWSDFRGELLSFIVHKTGNQADAEDILQEVFIKIIKHFDKVAGANNLRQYLYGIVRNALNDYFKHQQRFSVERDVPVQLDPVASAELNETIAACCIKPFIEQLPESYREALMLTEFQHISQKDLATQLNISYSGAKSRVQRGKEKLKAMITSCCAYNSDRYGNLMEDDAATCGCD
jgi:RNA polymerase sigma-70 factor, ECF subfamily